MSVAIQLLDPENACVLIRVSGVVSGRLFVERVLELLENDASGTPVHYLWDARALESLELEPAHVDEILRAYDGRPSAGSTGRTAWVARQQQYDEIARLFDLLLPTAERQRRGFADYEEALAWVCGR